MYVLIFSTLLNNERHIPLLLCDPLFLLICPFGNTMANKKYTANVRLLNFMSIFLV